MKGMGLSVLLSLCYLEPLTQRLGAPRLALRRLAWVALPRLCSHAAAGWANLFISVLVEVGRGCGWGERGRRCSGGRGRGSAGLREVRVNRRRLNMSLGALLLFRKPGERQRLQWVGQTPYLNMHALRRLPQLEPSAGFRSGVSTCVFENVRRRMPRARSQSSMGYLVVWRIRRSRSHTWRKSVRVEFFPRSEWENTEEGENERR